LSQTLDAVRLLVVRGDVRVSAHGYDELAADGIEVREIVGGLDAAIAIEDYPNYPKARENGSASRRNQLRTRQHSSQELASQRPEPFGLFDDLRCNCRIDSHVPLPEPPRQVSECADGESRCD